MLVCTEPTAQATGTITCSVGGGRSYIGTLRLPPPYSPAGLAWAPAGVGFWRWECGIVSCGGSVEKCMAGGGIGRGRGHFVLRVGVSAVVHEAHRHRGLVVRHCKMQRGAPLRARRCSGVQGRRRGSSMWRRARHAGDTGGGDSSTLGPATARKAGRSRRGLGRVQARQEPLEGEAILTLNAAAPTFASRRTRLSIAATSPCTDAQCKAVIPAAS